MNAKLPKAFDDLSPSEKKRINEYYTERLNEELDKSEAELQKVWLKLACIVLHDSFGFGKDRAMVFLGNWKKMYQRNAKLKSKKEQEEFLRVEMDKIFGVDGYPSEWIDKLENIK